MARIRRGSGVREADLLARAKALRQTVEPLLPKLTPDCPSDRFDRLRAELEEVRASSEETKRLERLARHGESIARAYAGLLRFALEPKPPAVVAFPVPGGEVSYAPLARTEKEAEVAVQRSDDPAHLILGYLSWARRGFHFFATRRALWCTGRSPQPPADFVTEKIAEQPYRLVEEPGARRWSCSHLAAGESRPYLEVAWPGADRAFRVCRRCAKDDRHLLASLSEGAVVPDPPTEFPVAASLNVRCTAGPACVHATLPELPRSLKGRYELGRLSDAQLVDEYLLELRPRLERGRGRTLVAAGTCYGPDVGAFLDALRPTGVERAALEAAFAEQDGYFELDEPSASRALEKLWSSHAETIVRAIVRDPAEAKRLLDETRGAPGRVAEVLKRAERRTAAQELLGTLPHYAHLVPEAAWADRIARLHRTGGAAAAERAIVETMPREGRVRGLAFGFLLALGRTGAHAWQFSPTEKEFGQALEARARALLEARPDGYHDALDGLLTAAGVAAWGTLGSSPTVPP